MSDFQAEKAVVRALHDDLAAATPETVAGVLARHVSPDWLWRGMHPFHIQTGPEAVAQAFWAPFLTAMTRVQRRPDIFIAGLNEVDGFKSRWVTQMGHLMALFDKPWLGIRPTYRIVMLRFVEFNRVEEGRITETAFFFDIPHLMMQAGQNPFPPQTGAFLVQPGPMTHEGLCYDPHDPAEGAETLRAIRAMNQNPHALPGETEVHRLSRAWHDDMIWWGPMGIGATYTLERYDRQHNLPWDKSLHDGYRFNGHIARLAEGNFGGFFGWANLTLQNAGGYMGMTGGGPPRRHARGGHVPRAGRQAGGELDLHRHPALPQHAGPRRAPTHARHRRGRRLTSCPSAPRAADPSPSSRGPSEIRTRKSESRAVPDLPFVLPERAPVMRIRQRDARELKRGGGGRTQPMAGFEDRFTDIVDYIVRITDEIWMERAVGYIYDTYAHDCAVYSSYGVVRSVEEVVSSTVLTLNAFPDGEVHHLNVAWSGDQETGFYTSHLGHSRSTQVGRTAWGPGSGRRSSIRFAADCISRENRIHTEWLVRDTGAQVRQLGFDPHEIARRTAETINLEHFLVSPDTRMEGQTPRVRLDLDTRTVDGWARALFHDVWNLRRLDWLGRHYAPDVIAHAAGGRVTQGLRNYQALLLHVMTALPDGVMRVEHVSWADETDGVIVAVRWVMEGRTHPGGVLGECPAGKAAFMMGISHLRLSGDRVVEEWVLFDEIGVLAQAYR